MDPSAQLGGSSATAASANNVTLTPDTNKTAYLTQVEITGNGATARGDVQVTITGVKGGTRNYWLNIPAGATTPITPDPLTLQFKQPLVGSAQGQAIVVNVPTFGAGNVQAAVNAAGFQL